MAVVVSDEELDVALAERLSDPALDREDKTRLREAHAVVMTERRKTREAVQAQYDSGKGRSGAAMFGSGDAS